MGHVGGVTGLGMDLVAGGNIRRCCSSITCSIFGSRIAFSTSGFNGKGDLTSVDFEGRGLENRFQSTS